MRGVHEVLGIDEGGEACRFILPQNTKQKKNLEEIGKDLSQKEFQLLLIWILNYFYWHHWKHTYFSSSQSQEGEKLSREVQWMVNEKVHPKTCTHTLHSVILHSNWQAQQDSQ